MSQYYRYSENSSGRSRRKAKWFRHLCVALTVALVATAGFALQKSKAHKENAKAFADAIDKIKILEDELVVLRAINPYQFNNSQMLEQAAAEGDLLPGWVTRVYTAPKKIEQLSSMLDLGAFVLDQTKFHLATHLSYGLETPENALYRMNGLVPSESAGRYQIGLLFSFDLANMKESAKLTKQASCFARIDVNNKRVIERKIRFVPGKGDSQLFTGSVAVDKGIHPISAIFYCDDKSYFLGENVAVSITFRAPGELAFKKSADSVFHVYRTRRS